jgi:hypothetical protein
MNAPSVFNFFRPGYSPPNTTIGAAGLVSPEFQITNEVTVAGYLNTMQTAIGTGIGTPWVVGTLHVPDIQTVYANETPLAANPPSLVDRLNLLLLYGQMSPGLRARILDAVNNVRLPAYDGTNQARINIALANRTKVAVFLTFASPEYLAQR